MTKETGYAIEVEKLTKRYGDLLAVNDISFTVSKGEVFALLGPNGAGKTTTVEIINTIRPPTSGKVTLLGMDVTKKKHDIVRRIGVLPQGFNSFDRITVRETLRYYSRLFSCRNIDIDGLIDLVNLREKTEEQYKNLSGGLRQRLGIAIALVNDPEVVFLDEPTTGLDPRARREVWEVLQGLKNRGEDGVSDHALHGGGGASCGYGSNHFEGEDHRDGLSSGTHRKQHALPGPHVAVRR